MVTFHVGAFATVTPAGTEMKPESKPPDSGWHGLAKDDCVTLWFPGEPLNWKEIVSPALAAVFDGMNWRGPPVATWTTVTV
jgi:hypothetical protein